MSTRKAAVLDLGSTKAVCMVASLDDNGALRIEAFSMVPCSGLERGVVTDVDATAEAALKAIEAVEADLGERLESVAVNIAGAHLNCHNSQGYLPIYPPERAIRSEDVLQVINHSRQFVLPGDREQVAAVPKEFRVDGGKKIDSPMGVVGTRLEVLTHIISANSSAINALEKAVAKTGRKLDQILVQSLASGLAVTTPEMLTHGSVVVDIGGETTDVIIFHGGTILYTACLPVGAVNFTKDLCQLLKVSMEEAERLKLEYGTANTKMVADTEVVNINQVDSDQPRQLKRQALCEILEARMREIGTMIQREIDRSGVSSPMRGGVTITGGGALLEGAESCLSTQLRHAKVRIAVPKSVGQNSRKVQSPQFSTAVGMCRTILEGKGQEFEPVSGAGSWKDRIRTLKSMFGG